MQANKDEWVEGMRGFKKGLKVEVLRTGREGFERIMRGGSLRYVERVSKWRKVENEWS